MSRPEFIEQCAAIEPTIRSLGLEPADIVLLGGSGLAAQGIDTHWGVRPSEYAGLAETYKPFDVDALIEQHHIDKLTDAVWEGQLHSADVDFQRAIIGPQQPGLLAFHGLRSHALLLRELDLLGVEPIMAAHLKTLPAPVLARGKSMRHEPRDTVGLVLGHLAAYQENHVVVDDPKWGEQIGLALAYARAWRIEGPRWFGSFAAEFAIPEVFTDLVRSNFDHPAFQTAGVQ